MFIYDPLLFIVQPGKPSVNKVQGHGLFFSFPFEPLYLLLKQGHIFGNITVCKAHPCRFRGADDSIPTRHTVKRTARQNKVLHRVTLAPFYLPFKALYLQVDEPAASSVFPIVLQHFVNLFRQHGHTSFLRPCYMFTSEKLIIAPPAMLPAGKPTAHSNRKHNIVMHAASSPVGVAPRIADMGLEIRHFLHQYGSVF